MRTITDINYSRKSVLDWFHRTLGVDHQPARDEVMTSCPSCAGDRFYFNIRKKVGICHRAACGYTPSLKDLIETVGFGPDETGAFDREEAAEEDPTFELPGHPILVRMQGQEMTSDQGALDYLKGRGLSNQIILNWGFTSDGERVYIPIMDSGRLVNYNSRVLPGVPGKKYLYAPGSKTSKYILGSMRHR